MSESQESLMKPAVPVEAAKPTPEVKIVKQDPDVKMLDTVPETKNINQDPVVKLLDIVPETRPIKQDPDIEVLDTVPETRPIKQDPDIEVLDTVPETRPIKQDPDIEVKCFHKPGIGRFSIQGLDTVPETKPALAQKPKIQLPTPKLGKAARRVLRRFIKQGIPMDRARQLAFAYDQEIKKVPPSIRQKPKPPVKVLPVKPPPKARGPGIRLVILPENHPRVILQKYQAQILQNKLIKKLDGQNHNFFKYSFLGITITGGYLVVECANENTARWVKSLSGKLFSTKGAPLKVVEEELIIRKYIIAMSLPNSKDDDDSAILKLLQSQNKGLKTCSWKILNRTETTGATEIELAVDYGSAETLKKRPPVMSYKTGQVGFRFREGKFTYGKIPGRNKNFGGGKTKQEVSSIKQETPFPDQKLDFINSFYARLNELNPFNNPLGEGTSQASLSPISNEYFRRESDFQNFSRGQFDERKFPANPWAEDSYQSRSFIDFRDDAFGQRSFQGRFGNQPFSPYFQPFSQY